MVSTKEKINETILRVGENEKIFETSPVLGRTKRS